MRLPLTTLLALLLIFGCNSEKQRSDTKEGTPATTGQPRTTMIASAIPRFDGSKAFAYLTRQTSFGPRNPNSKGHGECLAFLLSELRMFADEVRQQPFSHTGYQGETLQLTNILASFHPRAASRILLLAHWDTRPRAERDENNSRRNEPILGANDGASGVAVLLEAAALMKQQRPAIGVDLLLVDGEDYGREGDTQNYLLGARYFARNKPADYLPRFGILLDMVGDKFLEIPKEGYSLKFAPDVVDLVWGKARELGYAQFVEDRGEEIIDDHLPLNEAGIKTINLIDFAYPDETQRFWHTHQDIPENCSAESLEAVGRVILQVVYTQSP